MGTDYSYGKLEQPRDTLLRIIRASLGQCVYLTSGEYPGIVPATDKVCQYSRSARNVVMGYSYHSW